MQAASYARWIALVNLSWLTTSCVVGTEEDGFESSSGGDVASEAVGQSEQALIEDCVGTTQGVVVVAQQFVPCSALPFNGYGHLCTSFNGCFRTNLGGCQGFGGALIPIFGIGPVSCSTIPVSQCTSRAGCSLVPRCESHCEGNNLVTCVNNQPQTQTCAEGCTGGAGEASCVTSTPVSPVSVPCDPACTWAPWSGAGGGVVMVETFRATNTCQNTWKSMYYTLGVCAPGVVPCRRLDRVLCSQ